jgi:hypothetical protein
MLLLAACGSAYIGPIAGSSPSPSDPIVVSPAPGFDAVVTEKDHEVTVHVGQKIEVFLRAKTGMTNWGQITAGDGTVLAVAPINVMAARGVTVAAFKAVAAGQVTITSYAGPVCAKDQPCPMYAIAFSAQVTVVA